MLFRSVNSTLLQASVGLQNVGAIAQTVTNLFVAVNSDAGHNAQQATEVRTSVLTQLSAASNVLSSSPELFAQSVAQAASNANELTPQAQNTTLQLLNKIVTSTTVSGASQVRAAFSLLARLTLCSLARRCPPLSWLRSATC